MDLENKVEHLSDEIAQMKDEIGQTMAEMRRLMSGLGSPQDADIAAPPPREAAPRPAGPANSMLKGLTAKAKARTGSSNGGGLSLSEEDLELMLSEAQSAATGNGVAGNGGLSLEKLAQTMRGAQAGAHGPAQGANGSDGALTMSLNDLAKMLKESQEDAAKMEAGKRAAPQRRSASRPLVGGWGGEGNLDVNLMANLMRWVGSVKSRLGIEGMRSLVELYGLSGHLTPALENAIVRIASLSMLPDESDRHVFTVDDLVDSCLHLHGINYGSGRLPVGLKAELDTAEWWAWASEQAEADDEPAIAEDEPVTVADDEPVDDGWEIPSLLNDVPVPVPPSHEQEEVEEEIDEAPEAPPSSRTAYREAVSAFNSAMQDAYVPVLDEPVTASVSESLNGAHPAAVAVESVGAEKGATAPSREAYLSDVTDAEWGRLEALIPAVKPGGRPGKYARREILNGILYHVRTGCSWRSLPDDLPPWKIIHHYYRTWRSHGTWGAVAESLAGRRHESGLQDGGRADQVFNGDGLLEETLPAGDVAARREASGTRSATVERGPTTIPRRRPAPRTSEAVRSQYA